MCLFFAADRSRINLRPERRRTLIEENGLFRFVRSAARRSGPVATAMGRTIFVTVALLIVTVGVLATETRIPQATQDTSLRHTSKSSRMTECGGDEMPPPLVAESRSAPPRATPHTFHDNSFDVVFPEFSGAPQAHGLRAPPLV